MYYTNAASYLHVWQRSVIHKPFLIAIIVSLAKGAAFMALHFGLGRLLGPEQYGEANLYIVESKV